MSEQPSSFVRTVLLPFAAAMLGAVAGVMVALLLAFLYARSVVRALQVDEGGFLLFQGPALVGFLDVGGKKANLVQSEDFYLFEGLSTGGTYPPIDISLDESRTTQRFSTAMYVWPSRSDGDVETRFRYVATLSGEKIEAAIRVAERAGIRVDRRLGTFLNL